uniref:TerC family protein n=1 Tax=Syphacia muris TaxID=451379 RepID=A0A0N5ANW6_9BILA
MLRDHDFVLFIPLLLLDVVVVFSRGLAVDVRRVRWLRGESIFALG